ncbi:hypothetical protein [Pradoshia sp.]
MILLDSYPVINLFTVCCLFGFFIEFTFILIKDRSFIAAIIPSILFSPLYGLFLTIFLSKKPDSLLIYLIMIASLLFLLETIKQVIHSYLLSDLPAKSVSTLLSTLMIWPLFMVSLSEWTYPRLAHAIRTLPYSVMVLFIYSLLYIGSVYLIDKIFKELKESIEELRSIHSARTQVETAENEIIHGFMEMNAIHAQEEYLAAIHEECEFDLTDLDQQYEEVYLRLSATQQKLIKAYPFLLSAHNRFIPARRKRQSG